MSGLAISAYSSCNGGLLAGTVRFTNLLTEWRCNWKKTVVRFRMIYLKPSDQAVESRRLIFVHSKHRHVTNVVRVYKFDASSRAFFIKYWRQDCWMFIIIIVVKRSDEVDQRTHTVFDSLIIPVVLTVITGLTCRPLLLHPRISFSPYRINSGLLWHRSICSTIVSGWKSRD